MRDRILNFMTHYGALIEPEAVDYLLTKEEPIGYVQGILDNMDETPFLLTIGHLQKAEDIARSAVITAQKAQTEAHVPMQIIELEGNDILEKSLDKFSAEPTLKKPQIPLFKQDLPRGLTIISDITGNSTCEGSISDFKQYFNHRLKTLKKMLKEKRQMVGVRAIVHVPRADGTIKIIGMVSDIRMTKKGHKMLTLEDESDTIGVLLPKDSGLTSDRTVLDEVVGIIGTKSKDGKIIVAKELIRPDLPVNRTPNRSEDAQYVAFASDIHVGSTTFLSEQFRDFISWLKGNSERKKNIARKVSYVVIPGDTVDGIGIYPDQEEELDINDIYGQYEELARLIKDVPEHVKVIMLPGNHDAVRPAEPQPTFPDEVRALFENNVLFLGNPCYFSIMGVEILAYHGRSMDDFIKALPGMDYARAIDIMKEILKKRHLVPIYGGRTPIAPEHKDYLVINRIPDIFVTGHGHSTGMGIYRGVTLINASAWQSQTSFQKMHNFMPDPAKVPVFNLHTGNSTIIDFS
jgi:DNA polymerase II small subunit